MTTIKLTPPETQIVEVTNATAMATMILEWQQDILALLNHLKSVPQGTTTSQDGVVVLTLEGNTLAGYQLGLALAIEKVSQLPFTFIHDAQASDPAQLSLVD